MRFRLFIAAVLIAWLAAQGAAPATGQVDGISEVVTRLDAALESGRLEQFLTQWAPRLPPDDRRRLAALTTGGRSSAVTVRERARDGGRLLVDVFVEQERRGLLAGWLLEVAPGMNADGYELVSARELTSFTDLLRLELDESHPYVVSDLRLTGTDFTLTMTSGRAFAATVNGTPTALVLRGRGLVRFAPPIRAEQDQLRIFSGQPTLVVETNDVFVRINASEFETRVGAGSLRRADPASVDPGGLRRAMEVFDSRAGQSFNLAIGDLASGRWSIEPAPGGLLVDFRSDRLGWLTYAETPDNAEDVSLFDRARDRQIALYASPARRASLADPSVEARGDAFEVLHTDLDLTFAPERRWISGRASLQVRLLKPSTNVRLRLAPSLVIASAASPELGPLLALRAAGQDDVVLGLPGAPSAGDQVTINIQYHGRLEPQSLEGDVLTSAQPGSVPTTPRLGGDLQFLYSTRAAWYPQAGSYRHATARIRLTVPAEFSVFATGERRREEVFDANRSLFGPRVRQARAFEHVADCPVRYLAFLAARLAPADTSETTTPPVAGAKRGVAVKIATGIGLANRAPTLAAKVRSMMEFYEGLLGDAPYPALSVAALEDELPGGHSPAYFLLFNQPPPAGTLQWTGDPVTFRDAPDFFLAHEVAHQWWGQAVGPKTYHDQWISEGFAQYFAWLYVTSVSGPEVSRRVMARMRETAMAAAAEGPIDLGYRLGHLRRDSRVFRAIVYNKSAVVLHMLRRLLGEERFLAGLRRTYVAGRFSRLDTGDVQRSFEAEAGVPLARFFERWVKSSDLPEVRVTVESTRADGTGLRIEQMGPVFDLPLDVTVRLADNREERVTVLLTSGVHRVDLQLGGHPTRVVVDDSSALVRVRQR